MPEINTSLLTNLHIYDTNFAISFITLNTICCINTTNIMKFNYNCTTIMPTNRPIRPTNKPVNPTLKRRFCIES